MRELSWLNRLTGTVALLMVGLVLCGCPVADQGSVTSTDEMDQQPEPKAEPEPVAEPEPAVEPDPEPAVEPEPDVEPEPVAEPEPAVEPDPEPAVEPEPDVEPEPVAEPEPMVEPDPEPAVEPEPDVEPEPTVEPEPEVAPDLGPPLVDSVENLKQLDQAKPVWIDQKAGRVVMVGSVCQTNTPLEMFACLKDTKEHEAVVAVDTKAFVVHAGLLAIGANVGNPVSWDPQYVPAAGSEIEVTVHWKDKNGETQTARGQDWVLDTETKKPMAHPWVFAGSGFWQDEETGVKHYQAEGGDFICVSNFATAMLDLPIESSQANSNLMYVANSEAIPPRGTPVTLVLTVVEEEEGPEEGGPEEETE